MKTTSNWIDTYGIKRNRHDPERLADKYVKERLSQREIGKLCGTGSSTIGDQLRKYGISRKRHYREETWPREKYSENDLSIHEIADLVVVEAYAVRYWLVEHGIERRDGGFQSGREHPSWKGTGATNDSRLARWSEEVKRRDGYECISSSTDALHAHHVVPRYEDQREEMIYGVDNGETLCRPCHAKRHRERGDEQIACLIRNCPH